MLHVVDISDIDHRQKENEVNQILDELNLQSIPQIRVNNKCDIKGLTNLQSLNKNNEVWISAEKNIGIQAISKNSFSHGNFHSENFSAAGNIPKFIDPIFKDAISGLAAFAAAKR